MKLYVDLIMLLNFFLDFILLFSVSVILKRNVSIKKLLLGALIGAVSVIALFVNFTSLSLFLFKIFISIIMVLVTFSFKNFKYTINNLIYLYLVSIILGGFLYYLNNELSYKNVGLIFFHSGFSINWLIVVLSAPIIVFIYVRQTKKLRSKYSKMYEMKMTFLNGKTILLTGFLDTGNGLKDPYKKRPIIIINKEKLEGYKPKTILVPCLTVNKESLLKCFRIKKLVINNKVISKEILVGISDNNFNIDGVDCLLHENIIKEIENEKDN